MIHLLDRRTRILGAVLLAIGLIAALASGPVRAQEEDGEVKPSLKVEPLVVVPDTGAESEFTISGEGFEAGVTVRLCRQDTQAGQPDCDGEDETTVEADGTFTKTVEFEVPQGGIWISAVLASGDAKGEPGPAVDELQVMTTAMAAEEAEKALKEAASALTKAQAAAGEADEYRKKAVGAAEDAESAQTRSENAAGAAEGSQGRAEGAAEDAESAQMRSENAAGAAEGALKGADTAAGEAERKSEIAATAAANAAAAATVAAVEAATDGEGSSLTGALAVVIILAGIVAVGGIVILRRRLEEVRGELETAHATLDNKFNSALDKVYTALVVRDPGTSMSADAYEGLRKQVVAASTERRAHVDPPRVLRRLRPLRGWSYVRQEERFGEVSG